MTQTDVSEFPAIERAAAVLKRLDLHRQRQVLGFLTERYGWSLLPSSKLIPHTLSSANRSEFASMEEASEVLDGLSSHQQELALGYLAGEFRWKIQSSYKPPAYRGSRLSPKRRHSS